MHALRVGLTNHNFCDTLVRSAWIRKGEMDQYPTSNGNGNGRSHRVGRGYGHLQLLLLKTLDEHPAFFLVDVLGHPHTRSQYVALHRAARNLCDDYLRDKLDGELSGIANRCLSAYRRLLGRKRFI